MHRRVCQRQQEDAGAAAESDSLPIGRPIQLAPSGGHTVRIQFALCPSHSYCQKPAICVELVLPSACRWHHINTELLVEEPREGNRAPVRRPNWTTVAGISCELNQLVAVNRFNKNARVSWPGAFAAKCKVVAIGRECRFAGFIGKAG